MEQNKPVVKPLSNQKNKNYASNTFIYLTISTWIKDSHDLYDYQKQQQIDKQQMNTLNNVDNKQSHIPKAISDYILMTNRQEDIKKVKYIKKQYQLTLDKQKIHILRNNKCNESVADFRQFQKICKDSKYNTSQLVANIDVKPNFITKKIQFIFQPTLQQNQILKKNAHKISKKLHKIQPGIVVNLQNQPKGYQLKVGAIICFGKVRYYVREIMINGKIDSCQKNVGFQVHKFQQHQLCPQSLDVQNQKCDPTSQINQQQLSQTQILKLQKLQTCEQTRFPKVQIQHPKNNIKQEQQQQISCRICYDAIYSPSNPLINLCKCTGSCKYTHIQCLKHWIQNKVYKQTRQYCISFEKINCQICKTQIPMNIIINGECQQIVLIQRPQNGNYIMLQKLDVSKKNILILKNIPNEGISIGRDNSCYIKIQDITVSRFHATINYDKIGQKFIIFDKNSKFGTIVHEQSLKIEVGKKQRSVQIGRTLLSFVIKRRQTILADEIL